MRYLIKSDTKEIFIWAEELAKRNDMNEIDEEIANMIMNKKIAPKPVVEEVLDPIDVIVPVKDAADGPRSQAPNAGADITETVAKKRGPQKGAKYDKSEER